MHKPKVVIFWGKPKGPLDGSSPQPYANIGPKKPVYDQLLLAISKAADVYVAIGYENYPTPMYFTEAYHFLGFDRFEKVDGGIKADAVYDRSAKISFPNDSQKENQKVLNSSSFKQFSNNKWALYQKFPDFCPKTIYAETRDDFLEAIESLEAEVQYVVKPFNGLKGKGIEFGTKDEIKNYLSETPVIIQEFMETKEGIPGIVKGRHDLRVAVVDGQIVWATVRQPAGDSLLANVHQGGSITEVAAEDLPSNILPIVDKMSKVFKEEYDNPVYAIDFGFKNGKPFIYEINDQIGFPGAGMKKNTFVGALAEALIEKSSL